MAPPWASPHVLLVPQRVSSPEKGSRAPTVLQPGLRGPGRVTRCAHSDGRRRTGTLLCTCRSWALRSEVVFTVVPSAALFYDMWLFLPRLPTFPPHPPRRCSDSSPRPSAGLQATQHTRALRRRQSAPRGETGACPGSRTGGCDQPEFYLFLPLFLRSNSEAIRITTLKYAVQWFLVIFT